MGGMPIEGQKMSDVTLAVRGFVKGIAMQEADKHEKQ